MHKTKKKVLKFQMKEMVVPAKLNIHFLMPFSKSVLDFAFTVMTKKKQLWLITTHKIRSRRHNY